MDGEIHTFIHATCAWEEGRRDIGPRNVKEGDEKSVVVENMEELHSFFGPCVRKACEKNSGSPVFTISNGKNIRLVSQRKGLASRPIRLGKPNDLKLVCRLVSTCICNKYYNLCSGHNMPDTGESMKHQNQI